MVGGGCGGECGGGGSVDVVGGSVMPTSTTVYGYYSTSSVPPSLIDVDRRWCDSVQKHCDEALYLLLAFCPMVWVGFGHSRCRDPTSGSSPPSRMVAGSDGSVTSMCVFHVKIHDMALPC